MSATQETAPKRGPGRPKGFKVSEATRRRMVERQTGKKHTPETLARMSEIRERTLNRIDLIIGVLDRRAKGKSVTQIARALGISTDRVYRVIKAFNAQPEARA